MADNLVYQGQRLRIEYAVRRNGSMPAREFYEGLDEREQVKLDALFARLGDHGRVTSEHHFKKLGGHIWEFKRDQVRILCFFGRRGTVVLTNGFKKKSRKTPGEEIEKANRIREEHIGRREENA